MMKLSAAIGLMVGLAGAAVLVAIHGYKPIAEQLGAMGWGFVLLPFAFIPSLALSAAAWMLLFQPDRLPRFFPVLRGKWIGMSVNTLLPVAGIGGDVARARVLLHAGARDSDTVASIVVDKTVDAISVIVWGLFGVALLAATGADSALVEGALVAAALLTVGVVGFVAVQCFGAFGFLVQRFNRSKRFGAGTSRGKGLKENAADLDAIIRAIYRRYGRLSMSALLWILSRLAETFELWVAMALMGYPISIWDALLLKSLTGALRGAVFFVPGGWGLQEGAFIVVGGLLGFPADLMLAVALALRGGELLFTLPGLVDWQIIEGHNLWKRHARAKRGGAARP